MRVLVISNLTRSLVHFRGNLLKEMIALGHEVHAVSPDSESDIKSSGTLRNWGVTLHNIAMARAGLTPFRDLQLFWALYRLMRDTRPGLVFAYTAKPVIYGMFAARFSCIPHRYAMINGLGYAFSRGGNQGRRLLKLALILLYRSSLRYSHGVFFQNPDDRDDLLRSRVIAPTASTFLVNGSGIDTDSFFQVPVPNGSVKFLLMARLLGEKGVREYVAAAAEIRKEFPDATFVLVGDFDSNPDSISPEEVESWVEAGFIVYNGFVEDVHSTLAACDVFVLPSYYREGTPRSALEALSTGRAVVTTDSPGCRETVVHGLNGFLIEPRSVNSLISVLRIFLEKPELRESMGQASRKIAVEKYDVRKVNRQMIEKMGL